VTAREVAFRDRDRECRIRQIACEGGVELRDVGGALAQVLTVLYLAGIRFNR
jgi:hypothetical protein